MSNKVVKDIRVIPVKLFIDEEFVCPAQVKVVIDEDNEVSEQLIVDRCLDLAEVAPEQVACHIVHPIDAFAYFGATNPEMIGRDE
jgi:hypothetical protein